MRLPPGRHQRGRPPPSCGWSTRHTPTPGSAIPWPRPAGTGGTTLYVNGVDPGFSGDLLPLAALSLTQQADTIHVQEICDYGSYDDAEFTGASFGFGALPDHQPVLFLPGVLASIWGGPVKLLADNSGVEVDELREHHRDLGGHESPSTVR